MTLLSVSRFDLETSSFLVLLVASFLFLLGGGATGLIEAVDDVDLFDTRSTCSDLAFKLLFVSLSLVFGVVMGFSRVIAADFSRACNAPAA